MSQHIITTKDDATGRTITVRVPGTNGQSLQVEVTNNLLSVHYPMIFSSWGKPVEVPRIVMTRTIPYFIHVEGITASLEAETLYIRLPFNARANGYRRRVNVRQS